MGSSARAALTVPKEILKLQLSSIQGTGIFAEVPLPAGLQLGPYEGELECSLGQCLAGYQWKLKNGHLVRQTGIYLFF